MNYSLEIPEQSLIFAFERCLGGQVTTHREAERQPGAGGKQQARSAKARGP